MNKHFDAPRLQGRISSIIGQYSTSLPRWTLAALATAGVALTGPAWAQDQAADADEGGIEEIVVTARKREESLQETPISITAFTADALAEMTFTDLSDIADATPNLLFTYGGAASAGTNNALVFIRGVGQGDFLITTDPGVGIYIDGVYLGRMQGGILDLIDLERVEVLRGPQGTLFGRNTIGGAINAITTKPHDEYSGQGGMSIGNYNKIDVQGAVNVPLSDKIFAKVAFSARDRDGYIRRVLVGDRAQSENRETVRAAIRWLPSDNIDVTITADYTRERNSGAQYAMVNFACEPEPFCTDNGGLAEFYNRLVLGPQGLDLYDAQWEVGDDLLTSFGTGNLFNRADIWGVSATIDWDLGDFSAKSITAYRSLEVDFTGDADASPVLLSHIEDPSIFVANDQTQFSQEIQFSGSSLDDRLTWLVGGYFFIEDADDDQPVRVSTGLFEALEARDPFSVSPPGLPFLEAFCPSPAPFCLFGGEGNFFNTFFNIFFDTFRIVDNKSYAAFTHASYQITDQLSATAGVRYSREDKKFNYLQFPVNLGAATFDITVDEQWSSWSPKFGLEYQYDATRMVYASASRGFKSGGFNGRPVNFNSLQSYDPETLWSYEIGFKTDWLDRRLRLNVSAFLNDYQGIQLTSSQTNPDTGALDIIVENAGDAEMKGFEAEFIALPHPNLRLSGGVGLLDFKYKTLVPGTNVELTDILPKAPKWTVNLAGQFTAPLEGTGDLIFRLDFRHVSKYFNDPLNAEEIAEDGYELLNARVTFVPTSENWDVSAWVTNLTDARFFENGFDVDAFADQAVIVGKPRMWGFSVNYRF